MAITKVYLLDVPFEKDYKHTLYFANATAQYNYFYSRAVKKYTDFSYQRKDKFIRVPDDYDTIKNCNYVMYQNSEVSNKWYYAFIDKIEYSNTDKSDIYISTDVIQTYLFDYTIKPSFIEREHVNDDTIGKHTVPEELETGEYIDQPLSSGDSISWEACLGTEFYVVLAVTQNDLGLGLTSVSGKTYNGTYSGLTYITFPNFVDCDGYINAVQSTVTDNIIYACFMVPQELLDNVTWITPQGYSFQFAYVEFNTVPSEIKGNIPVTDTYVLDKNYSPRNKKLLTFPYRYIAMSNNAGQTHEYKYEYFKKVNNECRFYTRGVIGVGCSIKLFPSNYLEADDRSYTFHNYMESLDCAKLPTCPWINDPYVNWLTQNSVNMTINTVKNVGAIVGGTALAILSGGTTALAGGAVALGGVSGIFDQVKTKYEHSLVPDTAQGGANQGDLIFSEQGYFFTPYKKSIKKEYAQIIDNYFDMFGYKVNTVKVPNTNHRANWWYTKTIDVNITGSIPNEDLEAIKTCYNNGITFWKDPTKIYDYTQSNGIVS